MQVSLSKQSRLPDYKNDRITVAQWVLCVTEPRGFSVLLLGAVQPTHRHKQAMDVSGWKHDSILRHPPTQSSENDIILIFFLIVWNALLTYSSTKPDFVSWSLQKQNNNKPKAQSPNPKPVFPIFYNIWIFINNLWILAQAWTQACYCFSLSCISCQCPVELKS